MRLLTIRNIAQYDPLDNILVQCRSESAFQLVPISRRAAAPVSTHLMMSGAAKRHLSGNGNGYDAKKPN